MIVSASGYHRSRVESLWPGRVRVRVRLGIVSQLIFPSINEMMMMMMLMMMMMMMLLMMLMMMTVMIMMMMIIMTMMIIIIRTKSFEMIKPYTYNPNPNLLSQKI